VIQAGIGPVKASASNIFYPPRILVAGFLYWLLFLLALEPGNILSTGGRLVPEQELLRILGASLLGACMAPLLLAMVRRYPADGAALWRNAGIQIAGCIGIAAGGVAVSCVLADRFLATEHRPFLVALRQELEGNGPLVAFSAMGFAALAHTRIFCRIANDEKTGLEETRHLASVTVKTRGREIRVDLGRVDWIEAQGNYLALHCNSETHLLRMGLAALESKLDPRRFARIHRRVIVALDRVREIAPLGAGDAALRLSDGTELRLSRTYRPSFLSARAASSHPGAGRPAAAPDQGSLEVAPVQSYNS
jgi:hypothetical protein